MILKMTRWILEDFFDTLILVFSVGFMLFMGYSLIKYASFINHYPKNIEEVSKENEKEDKDQKQNE